MITKEQAKAAEHLAFDLEEIGDELSIAVAKAEKISEPVRVRVLAARKAVTGIVEYLAENYIYEAEE